MVTFELDYRDSRIVQVEYKDIQFYDKVLLIDIICSLLYDNRVRFIVSDNICKNYNMDCKFDLICLLDLYDETISALVEKRRFDIEFYEQGREYIFLFEATYNDMREIFLSFYQSLFQYTEKCIENIGENVVFCEWKRKLNELKLL